MVMIKKTAKTVLKYEENHSFAKAFYILFEYFYGLF